MDKREMKIELNHYMIKEMWQNYTNEGGETRQEEFLHDIGIENPTEAEKKRLRILVRDMFEQESKKYMQYLDRWAYRKPFKRKKRQ